MREILLAGDTNKLVAELTFVSWPGDMSRYGSRGKIGAVPPSW